MQRFMIAFTGRVGSSFLEALLDSHPDAKCYGEIFADHPSARTLTESDVRSRLAEMVDAQTGLTACGFKLPFCTVVQPPGILGVLRDSGYSVLHVTRRNKLEQAISRHLATINNAWRSDFGSYVIDKVNIDPSHLVEQVVEMSALDRTIQQSLSEFDFLEVAYEDLASGAALPGVLAFLGLPNAPLTSKYDRQRRLSVRDTLLNYDDVAMALYAAELDQYLE